MKKLLAIVLVLSLVSIGGAAEVFARGATGPGYAGDIAGMATGRYASDAHRTFRLVRVRGSAGNPQITADSMVVWDTDVAYPTASDGVTVTLSTTSGDSRVAGMLITTTLSRDTTGGGYTATEDVGQRNWGWLQTYGRSAVAAQVSTSGLLIGSAVCVGPTLAGSTSGFLSSAGTLGTTSGNAGFAMETTAALGTGYIFLKCE